MTNSWVQYLEKAELDLWGAGACWGCRKPLPALGVAGAQTHRHPPPRDAGEPKGLLTLTERPCPLRNAGDTSPTLPTFLLRHTASSSWHGSWAQLPHPGKEVVTSTGPSPLTQSRTLELTASSLGGPTPLGTLKAQLLPLWCLAHSGPTKHALLLRASSSHPTK